MIGLDDTIKAVASEDNGNTGDFKPLPKGWYHLELVEVKEWKEKVIKELEVIEFDDKLQKVKDASGNDVKTKMKNVKVYDNNLRLKVLEGDFKGRFIFSDIGTYPNTPWVIPNLIHALGKPSLKLSQLSTMVGTEVMGYVDTRTYKKKVEDDEGFETEVDVTVNVVKRFKPIEIELDINEEDLSDI